MITKRIGMVTLTFEQCSFVYASETIGFFKYIQTMKVYKLFLNFQVNHAKTMYNEKGQHIHCVVCAYSGVPRTGRIP